MSQEDRAQEQELHSWTLTQEKAKMTTFAPNEIGYGPPTCREWDCDEPISNTRRAMGAKHCVECKEKLDHQKRKLGL